MVFFKAFLVFYANLCAQNLPTAVLAAKKNSLLESLYCMLVSYITYSDGLKSSTPVSILQFHSMICVHLTLFRKCAPKTTKISGTRFHSASLKLIMPLLSTFLKNICLLTSTPLQITKLVKGTIFESRIFLSLIVYACSVLNIL